MDLHRRAFLRNAAAVPFAFSGLSRLVERGGFAPDAGPGFGPLVDDPEGLLDLPEGFHYRVLSRWGETMDDGLLVPHLPDGMGAFPGPDGTTVLVRNHEIPAGAAALGAFGPDFAKLAELAPEKVYDRGHDGRPVLGGTSTVVFDTREQRVVRHFLSLAGTARNCAGGPTPWNSWITCEEAVFRADATYARDHGYCFEVPANAAVGLADAVPLRALGRFNHEAAAVDPATGIVYETEDRGDALLYRFVPEAPGRLAAGGVLQALVVADAPRCDTSNRGEGARIAVGARLPVRWVALADVESPGDDLREQGREEHGCATFSRGEGMWWGGGSVYFSCTSGGPRGKGQIWRYTPEPLDPDGSPAESQGTLELFVEPSDPELLENCDNLTVAPFGDLIVCEDGPRRQHLVGVTPQGECYRLARNARSSSEFAGAVFSPDGTTLFVNLQALGTTLAITGPWASRAKQG